MKILPTKTVASVMATFSKTMTELESVATAPGGQTVTGVVCSGLLKGNTIRLF